MEDQVVVPSLQDLALRVPESIRLRYEAQATSVPPVVNPIVLAKLLGIPPQMVYNYIRNGRIKAGLEATATNNTQKVVIALEEAETWAYNYLRKKASKQAKIERELRGE